MSTDTGMTAGSVAVFQMLCPPRLIRADTTSVRGVFRDYRTYEKIFQDRKESKSIPAAVKPVASVEERSLKRLAKYEIGVALDELTTEAITEYLKALVEDTRKELDLDQLFGKLRFDLPQRNQEKLSAMFCRRWKTYWRTIISWTTFPRK
jgi:hypothetical protein